MPLGLKMHVSVFAGDRSSIDFVLYWKFEDTDFEYSTVNFEDSRSY